ncbi:hypothetical protein [Streptomyces sp. NPDC101234]|uniref:hypothetical protein n=1 Tax=Streptomyces sp. NPDC101234 TaxID=3366138 RepID=UPI00381A1114
MAVPPKVLKWSETGVRGKQFATRIDVGAERAGRSPWGAPKIRTRLSEAALLLRFGDRRDGGGVTAGGGAQAGVDGAAGPGPGQGLCGEVTEAVRRADDRR